MGNPTWPTQGQDPKVDYYCPTVHRMELLCRTCAGLSDPVEIATTIWKEAIGTGHFKLDRGQPIPEWLILDGWKAECWMLATLQQCACNLMGLPTTSDSCVVYGYVRLNHEFFVSKTRGDENLISRDSADGKNGHTDDSHGQKEYLGYRDTSLEANRFEAAYYWRPSSSAPALYFPGGNQVAGPYPTMLKVMEYAVKDIGWHYIGPKKHGFCTDPGPGPFKW